MPNNDDLNIRIPLEVVDESAKAFAGVGSGADNLRKNIEKPIRAKLTVDDSDVASAERKVKRLREEAARPIRTTQTRAGGVEEYVPPRASRTRRRSLSRSQAIGASGESEIYDFADSAIPFRVNRPQRSAEEQQIRDIEASILRAKRDVAKAEEDAAQQIRRETEARRRVAERYPVTASPAPPPPGDISGPAVRDRFDDNEQRSRWIRAQRLRELRGTGNDPDSEALRAVYGSRGGRKNSIADDIDAEFGQRAAEQQNARQNSRSRIEPARPTRESAGGQRADPLRTLANVLPGLGLSGVLLLAIRAVSELPKTIAELKKNIGTFGVVGGVATQVGDALHVGGISRDLRETFESTIGPTFYKAQQQRRDAEDAKRARDVALAERRARGEEYLRPVLENNVRAAQSERDALAIGRIRDPLEQQRLQSQFANRDANTALDRQITEGRSQRLSPDQMKALEQSVAAARKETNDRYAEEAARLQKEYEKRNADAELRLIEDRSQHVAEIQERIYEQQGNVLAATVSRITRESDQAIIEAKRKVDEAKEYDGGVGSYSAEARMELERAQRERDYNIRYRIPEEQRRDREQQRDRARTNAGTFEDIRLGGIRTRAEQTGDVGLTRQLQQYGQFTRFRDQYEQLRNVINDKDASNDDKINAAQLAAKLPGMLQQALKETPNFSARNIADATFTQAQTGRGQSGYGLAIRENALLSGGRDSAQKTAENTAKLVQLLTDLVQGKNPQATIESIFGMQP